MFLFRNLRFSPNYISWYLFRILTDYNYLLYICLFYNLFHFRLFSLKLTLEWFFFFVSFPFSFFIYLRILRYRSSLTIHFLFFHFRFVFASSQSPFLAFILYFLYLLFYFSAVFSATSSPPPIPLFSEIFFLSSTLHLFLLPFLMSF